MVHVTKESLAARIADLESGARSLKEDYTLAAYKMLLATLEAESGRNPVLAYADSYRDMAKQGVEAVPIWGVITDLERNIAPCYHHAQPAPVVPDLERLTEIYSIFCTPTTGSDNALSAIHNDCRAAMLAAAPQEVK